MESEGGAKRPGEESAELKRTKAENQRMAALLRKQAGTGGGGVAGAASSLLSLGGGGGNDVNLNGKGMVPSNKPCYDHFAGKPCSRNPCPFRHTGEKPAYNPALAKSKRAQMHKRWNNEFEAAKDEVHTQRRDAR